MGNRANVMFLGDDGHAEANVYLHWNGGPESIYAFLAECVRRKARTHDPVYLAGTFVPVVRQMFDEKEYTTLSLGIQRAPSVLVFKEGKLFNTAIIPDYCPGDNGIYFVYYMEGSPIPHLNGLMVERYRGEFLPRAEVLREYFEATTSHQYSEIRKFYTVAETVLFGKKAA